MNVAAKFTHLRFGVPSRDIQLANTRKVLSFAASVNATFSGPSTFKDNITTSSFTKRTPSSSQDVGASHLFNIRQHLTAVGISQSSADSKAQYTRLILANGQPVQ